MILRDSSRYYSMAELKNIEPRFFKGVRTGRLTNSAFETGIQTGLINELTFEQIQFVNYTYTLQDSYNEFATLMLTGLITIDIDESERKKIFRFLAVSMTDIVIKESELLIQYEKLLDELKSG